MTYNVKHLAASQRRHYRVNVPFYITINGKEYMTANWSVSGFCITGFNGKAKAGETLDLYVSVPFQGFNIGFVAHAIAVRHDPVCNVLAAEFKNLDSRSRKTLEMFTKGIISGEMEGVDGVIKRLDVPVTPISLAQEKSPLSPKEEAIKRQKGMHVYTMAGITLAIILMTVIYTNFFQLKVDTAVVMGTNDVINAPTAGTVTYIANINKDIPAGAPIVSITDPKLDYDISLANTQVQNATVESRRLDALLQAERERLVSANGIVSKQWESTSSLVSSLQKDMEAKGVILQKTRDLLAKGLETNATLQRVQSDYMETSRQLDQAKLSEVTLEQQLAAVKGGFQVRDQFVQTGMQDAQALANAAKERLDIARSQLDFLTQRKSSLTITAPADGRVVRVFTPLNSTAKLGDMVAVFERNGKRMIQAFLTQKEALNIIKGQKARVYTPYSWWSIPVRVVDIDYYSLTLHQAQGQFQWQNLLNAAFKTVMVMVEPVDTKNTETINQIAPGTAATVVF